MQDRINKNEKITCGDIVYIYQYKNRNNITKFEDLEKISVIDVVPRSQNEDIMVTGEKLIINEEGQIIKDKITGFVVYKEENIFIKTSEGYKYISYYIKNNKTQLCLKKIKGISTFYKIGLIFKLRDIAELRIDLVPDMLFSDEQDIDRFTNTLTFNKSELNSQGINLEINQEKKYYFDYDIYMNGNTYSDSTAKEKLLKFLSQNTNSKNNAKYGFNKNFSIRPIDYEFEEIPVIK